MGMEGRKVVKMCECVEHRKVEGSVERSAKEGNEVVRVRKCKECGRNFKTYEMTEDQRAYEKAGVDLEMKIMREKVDYYKRMVYGIKMLFEGVEKIKNQLEEEEEIRRL